MLPVLGPTPQSCLSMLVKSIFAPVVGSSTLPGADGLLGSAARIACGMTSWFSGVSRNGSTISGLVGNASRSVVPPPPPPPPAKPRGTAKPEAVSAKTPAPAPLSFSMSLRVSETLSSLSIFFSPSIWHDGCACGHVRGPALELHVRGAVVFLGRRWAPCGLAPSGSDGFIMLGTGASTIVQTALPRGKNDSTEVQEAAARLSAP